MVRYRWAVLALAALAILVWAMVRRYEAIRCTDDGSCIVVDHWTGEVGEVFTPRFRESLLEGVPDDLLASVADRIERSSDQLAAAITRLRGDSQPSTSPFTVVEVSGVMRGTSDYLQIYDISTSALVTLSMALALRPSLPPNSDMCIVSTDDGLIDAAGAENFQACYPYQL